MSITDNYNCILTIRILHEYYGDRFLPITLVPEPALKKYFATHGIYIKRINNSWYLYAKEQTQKYLKEDIPFLKLLIQVTDVTYHYVSDTSESNQENVQIGKEEHTLHQFLLISTVINDVCIKINTRSKYLEFILFPSEATLTKKVSLIETKGNLSFNSVALIPWLMGKKAWQFKSSYKVKLTHQKKYNIQLIELLEYGEQPMLQNMATPKPQSISITDPYNTITAFYTL